MRGRIVRWKRGIFGFSGLVADEESGRRYRAAEPAGREAHVPGETVAFVLDERGRAVLVELPEEEPADVPTAVPTAIPAEEPASEAVIDPVPEPAAISAEEPEAEAIPEAKPSAPSAEEPIHEAAPEPAPEPEAEAMPEEEAGDPLARLEEKLSEAFDRAETVPAPAFVEMAKACGFNKVNTSTHILIDFIEKNFGDRITLTRTKGEDGKEGNALIRSAFVTNPVTEEARRKLTDAVESAVAVCGFFDAALLGAALQDAGMAGFHSYAVNIRTFVRYALGEDYKLLSGADLGREETAKIIVPSGAAEDFQTWAGRRSVKQKGEKRPEPSRAQIRQVEEEMVRLLGEKGYVFAWRLPRLLAKSGAGDWRRYEDTLEGFVDTFLEGDYMREGLLEAEGISVKDVFVKAPEREKTLPEKIADLYGSGRYAELVHLPELAEADPEGLDVESLKMLVLALVSWLRDGESGREEGAEAEDA